MRRAADNDDFINDFPWIGGTPGKRAMKFTAIWICTLVLLAMLILISFITFQFVLAIILIFITAGVGTLPALFLIGSRI